MIDQTIPFAALTAGMARCVREWILPHLSDPMARIQAEQLAALLESLPRVFDPAALDQIAADSAGARALIRRLGLDEPPPAAGTHLEALMAENAALKECLEQAAAACRSSGAADESRLAAIRAFLVASARREAASLAGGQDFQKLTSRDQEGKR